MFYYFKETYKSNYVWISGDWSWKCNINSYSHHIISKNDYYLHSDTNIYVLERLDSIKDWGVIFDAKLEFDNNVYSKVNKFSSIIGL